MWHKNENKNKRSNDSPSLFVFEKYCAQHTIRYDNVCLHYGNEPFSHKQSLLTLARILFEKSINT